MWSGRRAVVMERWAAVACGCSALIRCPRGWASGLLATKGIPLRIAANREKGRVSWCQVGLPAQSLPRRRFRCAFRAVICTFCMCVCIYGYVCMCIYACVYVFLHLYVYTHVYVYVYAYLCIDCGSWYQRFSVWTPRSNCLRPGEGTTFLIGHFQGEANTQAGLIFVFFSVSVFTTGLVTDIYPPSLLLGVCAISFSPWSRILSFSFRVYHSILIYATVCTVLISQ